ncbi:unnamed protein product, partial [Symbiodinium pilosum]
AGEGLDEVRRNAAETSKEGRFRWGRPPRNVLLMTYASGELFLKTQKLMDESLHIGEITDHLQWNESEWESAERADWYKRHEN